VTRNRIPIRLRLLLKSLVVSPLLILATWFAFSVFHDSLILLRKVQAGQQSPDQVVAEALTSAAIRSFQIKEQHEVLDILEGTKRYDMMVDVLQKMVVNHPDQLRLRLQLADSLAAGNHYTAAHGHYEYLLKQLGR